MPDEEIVATVRRSGLDTAAAADELASLDANPHFQVARRMQQRMKKLESLLDVHRATASLSFGSGTIERRSRISRAEFLERYYAANRPVILTGLLAGSGAMSKWNPDYLRATAGDASVEIMAGRDKDARYEVNAFSHRKQVRFAEYIDLVLNASGSNDAYLVANNGFFKRPEMKPLFDDVHRLPEYLDPAASPDRVFFWFGPAGTVTPLHHDVMNVLATQVCGRKRFILISPDQSHLVYNNVGVYGDVDCENPDYEKYPRYRDVNPITVELRRGDALFIPVGWWHHVRALDMSITVSYTNFAFPNSYEWAHPSIHV